MCFIKDKDTFLENNKGSHSSTITTDHESGIHNCIKERKSSYDSNDIGVYETPREHSMLNN